jgi:hypothetical protein
MHSGVGMVLGRILGKWHGWDSSGWGQGPVEGSCEHTNTPSRSVEAERLVTSQEGLNSTKLGG